MCYNNCHHWRYSSHTDLGTCLKPSYLKCPELIDNEACKSCGEKRCICEELDFGEELDWDSLSQAF